MSVGILKTRTLLNCAKNPIWIAHLQHITYRLSFSISYSSIITVLMQVTHHLQSISQLCALTYHLCSCRLPGISWVCRLCIGCGASCLRGSCLGRDSCRCIGARDGSNAWRNRRIWKRREKRNMKTLKLHRGCIVATLLLHGFCRMKWFSESALIRNSIHITHCMATTLHRPVLHYTTLHYTTTLHIHYTTPTRHQTYPSQAKMP